MMLLERGVEIYEINERKMIFQKEGKVSESVWCVQGANKADMR